MKTNQIHEIDVGSSTPRLIASKSKAMSAEGLRTKERIEEILTMCARENPVYEQISTYSVALYAMGFFPCADLMSFQDVDSREAAAVLRDYFTEIREEALPNDYHILDSRDRYLMVGGDPLFPVHFAVFVDSRSPSPFFSKLPFFGSGFDSLEELKNEFIGIDGIKSSDFHYFKKIGYGEIPLESRGKIYIVKND
ncbi:MAG: hypothetical protein FP816_12780 [Desulfobacteraceae bacterium]|nr:hypothetical protein [Desulfobacteraceae bacterium]MBU4054872.1 hypothetical protein [Pseudomonadota bacterium]